MIPINALKWYVLLAALLILPICQAQEPYRSYVSGRSRISDLVGNSEYLVRYSISEAHQVSAVGFNSDASQFFRISGILKEKSPHDAQGLTIPESYHQVELLYSDQKGSVYQVDLSTRQARAVHITHSSYEAMLQAFDFYSLESKLEHSPYSYLRLEKIPPLLESAKQVVWENQKLSQTDGAEFLPPFGFTCIPRDGLLEVGFLAEHRPAWYGRLKEGDRIIKGTVNFEEIPIQDLHLKLKQDGATFVRLWIEDSDPHSGSEARIVDLYRETALEARLYQPPPR